MRWQGAALFRALSHDQLASLRHFEVTVLERVAGSRRTTLQPRSWNYIAVTDAALLLVARFGKARSMVAIPLAHITQVVRRTCRLSSPPGGSPLGVFGSVTDAP